MKAPVRWLIVVGLMLSGLTCRLANVNITMDADPTAQPISQATFPAAPPLSVEEVQPLPPDESLAEQVETLRAQLDEAGELFADDINSDGVSDFAYVMAVETLAERVYAMPSAGFNSEKGSQYEVYIELGFLNMSASAKTLTYTFEVPVEFATSADELIFEPQPERFISRSPVVVEYIIQIAARTSAAWAPVGFRKQDNRVQAIIKKAKAAPVQDPSVIRKALKEFSFPVAVKQCEALSGGEKDLCLLNLVEDFREVLPKKDLGNLCVGIKGRVYAAMCKGLAEQDLFYCKDPNIEAWERDVCSAYLFTNDCDTKSATQDDFDLCMSKLSLIHNSTTGCLVIKNLDIQNACLAIVLQDKKYCERIPDPKKRQECLDSLNDLNAPAPDNAFNPPPGVDQPGYVLPPIPTVTALPATIPTLSPPTPLAIDASKLNAAFWAKANVLVAECNRLNCANHHNYSGCALDCRGIGGFFGTALYNSYFLNIHRDYEPRANHVGDYLLGNLQSCNEPFVNSQENNRYDVYAGCIKRFNDEGARLLEIAWDDTCAVWCSEQGKTGKADGVPRTCWCE